MKTLKEVAVGQTVTVKKLSGAGPVKRRIMYLLIYISSCALMLVMTSKDKQ